MSAGWIILIVVVVVMIGLFIFLYFFGKRTQKKQDEQKEDMQKSAMQMSFYIIDKKKMLLKNAGLPKVVYDNANFIAKVTRTPVIKVKVGNKVTSLVCDPEVYKTLLPKQEVRAQVSGIYVISAKRVRGPVYEGKVKRDKNGNKKESFIDKLR